MYRILIVEDEPRIVAFVQKGLQRAGFTTEVTYDGETALAVVQTQSFDLMLLDLGLPRKDGQTLLEEMRSQGITLPVIILTARSMDDSGMSPILASARRFIRKPFRMGELVQAMQQVLQPDHGDR